MQKTQAQKEISVFQKMDWLHLKISWRLKEMGIQMNQKGVCWVRQNILILIYFWHMHFKKK